MEFYSFIAWTSRWINNREYMLNWDVVILMCSQCNDNVSIHICYLTNTCNPLMEIRGLSQRKDGLFRYGDFHYKDQMVVRPSYLYNGYSYTGKTTSLYWGRALTVVIPSGGRLNIKMSSYQCRNSNVKDKTITPTILSLTWESPYWERWSLYWDGAISPSWDFSY